MYNRKPTVWKNSTPAQDKQRTRWMALGMLASARMTLKFVAVRCVKYKIGNYDKNLAILATMATHLDWVIENIKKDTGKKS